MKHIKVSSFIFILIALFLLIDFIGYRLLSYNLRQNHEKESKILFYQITNQTSSLLSKLNYNIVLQKEDIIKKHKEVEAYIYTHGMDANLTPIYEQINTGLEEKPYNIYIADEDLIIRNTTYKPDEGFNLTFAKEIYDEHQRENIIGFLEPIREKKSDNFMSYTDSYLNMGGNSRAGLMEVSYTYTSAAENIRSIEALIKKHPSVIKAKAYGLSTEAFAYEMVLHRDPAYKRTNETIVSAQQHARALLKKLQNNKLKVENYTKDGKHYKKMYMLTQSAISKENKIIYTLLLDEEPFYESMKNLNIIMFLISVMGIVAILFIAKIRTEEQKLLEQDSFVRSAMHEIKTPLSVITLNNELRQLEYGEDEYGKEIDSALRLLRSSYESMTFIVSNQNLEYPLEILALEAIVEERVQFFQTIALSQNKIIVSDIQGHCKVEMSHTELVRLIDNTLSNAIKYSKAESEITVTLKDAELSVHNVGTPIKDKKRIFNKYYRENQTVGGYGLGLGIIKEIAKKYNITLTFHSDTQKGTMFTYLFKCHTDDISFG